MKCRCQLKLALNNGRDIKIPNFFLQIKIINYYYKNGGTLLYCTFIYSGYSGSIILASCWCWNIKEVDRFRLAHVGFEKKRIDFVEWICQASDQH